MGMWEDIIREEGPQANRIAEWMASYKPATILDVGCGPGIYVEAMRDVGLDAYGIDNGPLQETPYLRRFDVTTKWFDKSMPFDVWIHPDVVLSLEVGEHIPFAYHKEYIELIKDTGAPIVYFSAARPGQGGEGHIALASKAYWVELFHEAGFWLDPDATDSWLGWMRNGYHLGWITQNGMIMRTAAVSLERDRR